MSGGLADERPSLGVRRNAHGSAPLPLVLGAVALVLVGAGAVAANGLSPAAAVAALGLYAVVAVLVLGNVDRAHPFAEFGIANGITLVRAVLNCLLAGLALEVMVDGAAVNAIAWTAAALASFSLALDGLDGRLARRRGRASAFGARFDVEVDALLSMVLAVIAVALGKVGAWVLGLGLAHYAFLVARVLWTWMRAPMPPSAVRKTVFVVQATLLILLVLPPIPPAAASALASTALALVSLSFARDIVWLARQRPLGAIGT